jgi:hypothetical protein
MVCERFVDIAGRHDRCALGMSERVRFEVCESYHFMERQRELSYDFIFLDEDHSEEAVLREIPMVLRPLSPTARSCFTTIFRAKLHVGAVVLLSAGRSERCSG